MIDMSTLMCFHRHYQPIGFSLRHFDAFTFGLLPYTQVMLCSTHNNNDLVLSPFAGDTSSSEADTSEEEEEHHDPGT